MTDLYFTQAVLRRDDRHVQPMLRMFMGKGKGSSDVHHRMLWSLFDQKRDPESGKADFLWRYDGRETFLILGPKPDTDSVYFDVQTKPFSPELTAGQTLKFNLRCNATMQTRAPGEGQRNVRHDVVTAAMYNLRKDGVEFDDEEVTHTAISGWLKRLAERDGFSVAHVDVVNRRNVSPHAGRTKGNIAVTDVQGVLTVRDPGKFMERVLTGFGKAKYLGLGLMLLAPAA